MGTVCLCRAKLFRLVRHINRSVNVSAFYLLVKKCKWKKRNNEQRNAISNYRKYVQQSIVLINNSPKSLIFCEHFRICKQLSDAIDYCGHKLSISSKQKIYRERELKAENLWRTRGWRATGIESWGSFLYVFLLLRQACYIWRKDTKCQLRKSRVRWSISQVSLLENNSLHIE